MRKARRKTSLKSWFDKNHIKYDLIHCENGLALIIKTEYKAETLKYLKSIKRLNYWEYIVDNSLIQIYIH